MLQTQQRSFYKMGQTSSYKYNSIKLTQQKIAHFKSRKTQIQNQFELLDVQGNNQLFKHQIQNYLQEKYQWVNKKILQEILKTMKWSSSDAVTKQQFCSKYLEREKKLFHEYNKLSSQSLWISGLNQIYRSTLNLKPNFYVSVYLIKTQIYDIKEDFVDIIISYEDHEHQIQFQVIQSSHQLSQPSFQLILPSQQREFFVSYKFTSPKNKEKSYGQTYISILLQKDIRKEQYIDIDIRKDGQKVGFCKAYVCFQERGQQVKKKINQKIKHLNEPSSGLMQQKQKQYEYVQFLWGIRHKPPGKITSQQIQQIIVIRTILIIFLGLTGMAVQVLGRCQPLSLIICFLLLKLRSSVILRNQKFLLTWFCIASLLLDGIWLVFSSHHISQINYLKLESASIVTYALVVIKLCMLIYLIIYEKPFSESSQQQNGKIVVGQ